MPLLGAIGNASEYSFRGTYDNYPFDIDFGDLIDVEPGQIYTTLLKLVDGINYKVPISISGDGEYFVGNVSFFKTFDNDKITFDQTATTFDTTFPELDYSTLPTYVRNGNTVALRIIGAPPGTEITQEYYDKTYSTTVTIGKRDFTWTVKTLPAGITENLEFADKNDVDLSSEIISDPYTVSGLTDVFNYTAEITSNEGLVSVNGGNFVTSTSVKNGDIIRLKVISSDLNFTSKTITVRIFLNQSPSIENFASWNIRTLDRIPDNLLFDDVTSAELSTDILSNTITIQGLSDNIDFNVSVISNSGLLSVNGSEFVRSTTIRNNDLLQLRLSTSPTWLVESTVTVQLEETLTNWKVRNRTIEANVDSNAGELIYAIPFNTINSISDMSPEVREKNSFSPGLRSSVLIGNSLPNSPQISRERSRYYGTTGSYKMAKGITSNQFEVNYLTIGTDQSQVLGFSDFTLEMWMWASGFGFGGEVGMSIFYPTYLNNRNLNDYFFQLFLKGDNWPNSPQFRRGLLLGYPDSNGIVQLICETTSQVLAINSWNHIALTRSGNVFRIWVNGINYASGIRSMDLTSRVYNFNIPNFQRLINEDHYIQDLRLYKGVVKYTSNFNPASVSSIMEQSN